MRETRILEFKETITNTFLKTVSAFSNYNGGTILFGVDDNGNVKVQITLKRNASSATAELLFHFLRYEVPLDDIILFHAYLYRSFPDDMYDVYL